MDKRTGLSNERAKRSVIAKDLRPGTTEKDLITHFERWKNGGGRVETVTLGEESAVVTFEAQHDAENVLEMEHKVNGSVLRLQPYKQTQEICDTEVSAEVTPAMLKMNVQEASNALAAVKALTNVQWRQNANQVFTITGSLAEIQKAHQCLRDIILRERCPTAKLGGFNSCKKPSIHVDERTVREVFLNKEDAEDFDHEHSEEHVTYETESELWTFLSRFYKEKLTKIEQQNDIKISWNVQDSRITLNPLSSCNADKLRTASRAFVKLYQDVRIRVTSKHFCLKESNGNDRKAIMKISKEFPILIERSEDRTQWIIYGEEESVAASLTELKKACAISLEPPTRPNSESSVKDPDSKTGGTNPAKTAQFQKPLFGNVKVSVYQGDITEQHVDAIVNAANEQLAHVGGLALSISRKGGWSIGRESKKIIKTYGRLQVGKVVHTGSGNLPCKFVIHAVGPEWRQEGERKSRYLLRAACLNSLYEAEELKVQSIAFPAISSGIFGVPTEVCAQVMFDAVEEYSGGLAPQQVSDIRFIIIDDATVRVFREEFIKRYRSSQDVRTSNHTKGKGNLETGRFTASHGPSGIPTSGKSYETPLGASARDWTNRQATKDHKELNQENQENKCPVCLDTLKNPRLLKKCNHTFCKSCIDEALKVKKQCPLCKTPCGTRRGNQPPGSMIWTVNNNTHLPGYERQGTIIINYRIPAGIQSADHPRPGQQYAGTDRTAYLPDCPEGNEVLKLLKKAFDARLVFTVGTSRTSGIADQTTWNNISHKTSIHGGPTSYGYPDPTYIPTVKADLAAKGIQ